MSYTVEYQWFTGFVEKFTCPPLKKEVLSWYNNGMALEAVTRIIIKDDKGEVLHDVQKENRYVKATETPKRKRRTQTEKAASSETGSRPRRKRAVKSTEGETKTSTRKTKAVSGTEAKPAVSTRRKRVSKS
jgi:hypothetical protein